MHASRMIDSDFEFCIVTHVKQSLRQQGQKKRAVFHRSIS